MKSPLKQTGEYDYQPSASGVPFGQMIPEVIVGGGSAALRDQIVQGQAYGPNNANATMLDGSQGYIGSTMGGGAVTYDPSSGGSSGGGFGSNFMSNMSSPQAAANVVGGIGGIIQGLVGRGKRKRAQREAQGEFDKMMAEYQNLDTSNLYADVENKYMNMENTYEDLTVNQQQAQFERQAFQQSQANIMQSLSGAAGGSGIAALAQAMANQGQLAAQKAGASIGMQGMRLAGAETARGLEYRQTGTQLGMAQQGLAAANQAAAAGDAALYGGIGSVAGQLGAAAISDRRLKKNISLIGKSPNGLNIYSFEYINSKFGNGLYQGVMSDEIPFSAVIDSGNGYDMVNYNAIDVEFKRID